MKKLNLNIQLFGVSTTITNGRLVVDEANNRETQRITFTVKRTSGTTYWGNPLPLKFTLKYYNDDNTQTTLTQTVQFNFPSGSIGYQKSAYVDFIVPHKSDGTQTIYYEATITTPTSAGTLNPTGSAILSPISSKSVRIMINSVFKNAMPYVYVNNQWKKGTAYVYTNNQWKKGE